MPTTHRSREEVIADLIMQQHPKLMDDMGKYMKGELALPPDVDEQVCDYIVAEKEMNQIYEAAEREDISADRLDAGVKALLCPIGDKMRVMETCFPVIACSGSAVMQKFMTMELAHGLMLEVDLVIKDYKQWWKKHHKASGFPLNTAQNAVRSMLKNINS